MIVAYDEAGFIVAVNNAIKDGYQPYGTPHIVRLVVPQDTYTFRLCMAKHEPAHDNRTQQIP